MGLYLRPAALDEALAALAARPMVVLAGGTDHFPVRAVRAPEEDILDITGLVGGFGAIAERDDHWWVPCQVTWSDLIAAKLPAGFDGLKTAARQVGGRQVQNAGTLVGNLCNASPAADGIPCLLALRAQVELASLAGRRLVDAGAFVAGPRRTLRRPDELVLGLRVPKPVSSRSVFLKLGARRYLVISIAMVAMQAELAADGTVVSVQIAVGACSARAQRLQGLEAALMGRVARRDVVEAEHLAGLSPIDDVRGTAGYRRAAALELVRRAVDAVAPGRAAA
jgi:CO/xanthine dehydrogenase FAD-binding subunit